MAIYYEDIEIRETFEIGYESVSKSEIVDFASRYDPQPFHIDEEAAKDSMFGELVASGIHTLCIATKIWVTRFVNGEEGLANMGGLGINKLRWHSPVYPGDELHLEAEATNKEVPADYSDRGYVNFDRILRNGSGDVVLTFDSRNIVKMGG